MIGNYFRVAFRNLLKNKSYVIINTLGLGISLACCITAYLLVAFNIEFDNFHQDEKVKNIFAIHALSKERDGKPARDIQAPIMLAPMAAEEISGIKRYIRYIRDGGALVYKDKAFSEGISFADSSFFDLFDFPMRSGSAKAFKEKNAIFIDEEIAAKYFGDEDPVGKMMLINFVNDNQVEVVVGGVLKKFPINNTFELKVMMRFEHYIDIHKIKNG
jgi:putative ABC transport system permease protein